MAAAAILLASLAIREAFPLFAIANAYVDDLLFIRLAASISAGDWLGPYNQFTLAKGAGYPAFIALNSFLGFPLKLTEHVVYLSACGAFSWSAGATFRSRAAALCCLSILAFNPVLWDPHAGGRVIREGLYTSLGLWILALTLWAFTAEPAVRGVRERAVSLVALGALGGIFWLTREEGVWLVPSVAVIVAAWAVRNWCPRVALLAVPFAAFAVVVAAVDSVNYVKYGVFRNNEFRSRDFQQGYGALQRILHESPRPYVLFPKDAREKAYRVSPAARDLATVFEGQHGDNWRRVGCEQTATDPCPEILAGWFMWALRDAAEAAGHHASAGKARAFYRSLGREVNEACDRNVIPCGPRSDSLVPPWRSEYASRTLESVMNVTATLATLGRTRPHVIQSVGSMHERAVVERVTRNRLAGSGNDARPVRMEMASHIARAYVAVLPGALALAAGGWVVLIGVSLWRRQWHWGHVLVAALAAAIAVRVALLGFLEATSIPSNSMLYLSPVTPMTLAIVPCVLFLAIDMFRRRSSDAPG